MRYLNISKNITAVASGRLDPNIGRDILLVGTNTDVMAYDVEENRDVFFKKVPDGVNAVVWKVGATSNRSRSWAVAATSGVRRRRRGTLLDRDWRQRTRDRPADVTGDGSNCWSSPTTTRSGCLPTTRHQRGDRGGEGGGPGSLRLEVRVRARERHGGGVRGQEAQVEDQEQEQGHGVQRV